MLWQEWWIWVVAGLVLAALEVIAPAYILLGFAIGTAATGGLLALGLFKSSLPVLFLIAAIISLLAWLAMRRIFGIRRGQVKIWDRDINDNSE